VPAERGLPGLHQPVRGQRLDDVEHRARRGHLEPAHAAQQGEQRHDPARGQGRGVRADQVPEQDAEHGERDQADQEQAEYGQPALSRQPDPERRAGQR
jgi:hypothetical protein